MCSGKSLEAGQTWEILKGTLWSFLVPMKVMSLAMVAAARGGSECGRVKPTPPSLTALQFLLDLIVAALL